MSRHRVGVFMCDGVAPFSKFVKNAASIRHACMLAVNFPEFYDLFFQRRITPRRPKAYKNPLEFVCHMSHQVKRRMAVLPDGIFHKVLVERPQLTQRFSNWRLYINTESGDFLPRSRGLHHADNGGKFSFSTWVFEDINTESGDFLPTSRGLHHADNGVDFSFGTRVFDDTVLEPP
eukprot:scaffold3526_cov153-Amphora_coffeaeformis.AAC.14